jgi:hypothetical protein
LHGTFTSHQYIPGLTSRHRNASRVATYLKASESEVDSVTSAAIRAEGRPSTPVFSRSQLIGTTSLVRNETFASSGSITPTLLRSHSAIDTLDPTGQPRTRTPTPVMFSRATSARPLGARGGRVGLPPRPKLDITAPSHQGTEDDSQSSVYQGS